MVRREPVEPGGEEHEPLPGSASSFFRVPVPTVEEEPSLSLCPQHGQLASEVIFVARVVSDFQPRCNTGRAEPKTRRGSLLRVPRDGVLRLEGRVPSPFASPDHVELEEFPPSTFDEVPPSETSVKTEKTRQRTNTRAARNIPSTAPTGSDQELAKWLSDNNIDTTAWGEGNAKSVGSLRNEILSKESTLVLEEGRPLRSLRVAKVRVQRSRGQPALPLGDKATRERGREEG